MLTADLVSVRRKGDELLLRELDAKARERALEIPRALLPLAEAHVGRTREELEAALASVSVAARDVRLKAGLVKLIEDRCVFDEEEDVDPAEVREEIFFRAAEARRGLAPGERFDCVALIAQVAAARTTTPEAIERAMFADLRAAHVLRALEPTNPDALVIAWEDGQAQAVLLRATQVRVNLRGGTPGALRALFHRLKFLQLLHFIAPIEGGHRVTIDGPFSLFEAQLKYGLKLALVLPALRDAGAWSLEADVRWGKDRKPLLFRLRGGAAPLLDERAPRLPDAVEELMHGCAKHLPAGWTVTAASALLELPGAGLCVPDLVFSKGQKKVYVEVMGYWSRAAVWRRVELVEKGLATPVLFCVSSRLRVSEEVLPEDAPAALYVYKGSMSARAVVERVAVLADHCGQSSRG